VTSGIAGQIFPITAAGPSRDFTVFRWPDFRNKLWADKLHPFNPKVNVFVKCLYKPGGLIDYSGIVTPAK